MGNSYRNIAVIGADGAGKTTLSAAIWNAKRKEVKEVSPKLLDLEPEEQKRGFTLTCRTARGKWGECTVNVLDTPGFSNFLQEAELGLLVADMALIAVDSTSEAPHQPYIFSELAAKFEMPTMLFLNKMDLPRSKFKEVMDRFHKESGMRLLPLCMPAGTGENFKGVIDLFSMQYITLTGKAFCEAKKEAIPADFKDDAEEMRIQLVEAIAEAEDALMNKYLEDQPLTEEELTRGLKSGFTAKKFVPVFVGAATQGAGIATLLDFLTNSGVVAEAQKKLNGFSKPPGNKEDATTIDASPTGPFVARVFKTTIDRFTGRMNYVRVYSGKLSSATQLYNPGRDTSEKAASFMIVNGDKQEATQEAEAGDVVVLTKLKETKTGDTLTEGNNRFILTPVQRRKPMITLAITPKDKADEDKMSQAMNRILEEDFGLTTERDQHSKELWVYGHGQPHLEIAIERMRNKSSVEALLKNPSIPYRETIKKTAKGQGKYKKQSGGRGQYGDIWIEMKPLPRGSGFQFVDAIVGQDVPRNFLPAVEKGIREASDFGPVGGFPMVDFSATAYDGSHHPVDSSELAFKVAGSLAYKKVSLEANPVILEPVMKLRIRIPEEYLGDIIGSLNSRRGKVQGMEQLERGWQVVNATVPLNEVLRYAPEVQSMTQGNGNFEMEFSHYEELPANVVEKVVAECGRKPRDEEG